jgi:hypothetical protein
MIYLISLIGIIVCITIIIYLIITSIQKILLVRLALSKRELRKLICLCEDFLEKASKLIINLETAQVSLKGNCYTTHCKAMINVLLKMEAQNKVLINNATKQLHILELCSVNSPKEILKEHVTDAETFMNGLRL